MPYQLHARLRFCRTSLRALALFALPLLGLSGCATVGSVMSPYSEKFSCKNSDHGQCIHPDQAYADALAGRTSKSDPAVTNDRKMLAERKTAKAPASGSKVDKPTATGVAAPQSGQGNVGALIEGPGSPMLRPSRTIRTLILPYADKQRPDRLYMARYVYSIIDRPAWVVGDYLVEPGGRTPALPVLRTVREPAGGSVEVPAPEMPLTLVPENRP
ncbi:type IV conjugative transfer system lipoprotein TraV [Sphingobium cupriresistens]|uniref:Type IV conjugative transfer system protein TraV n=1 Tax=Sphingobium cupriresistens TaxID=1132417 RepID=A0A8G1ZEE2_9SPHN|nr:type IV conjugative transfer system lipoprotein TraV [Sphingobium cupriresistens]RYM09246.1 type IV conjugative transfer system protein TraV [Sphingobium cupriresistens]